MVKIEIVYYNYEFLTFLKVILIQHTIDLNYSKCPQEGIGRGGAKKYCNIRLHCYIFHLKFKAKSTSAIITAHEINPSDKGLGSNPSLGQR